MLWGIGAAILVTWVYIFFGREWLVSKWPDKFSVIHSIEDKLWERSRTLLAARIYWVGGIILFIHDSMAMSDLVDWTPIIGQFSELFPEKYRNLVVTTWPVATGILFEALRWMTTQSVEASRETQIEEIQMGVSGRSPEEGGG
jgi:hypothetical protein